MLFLFLFLFRFYFHVLFLSFVVLMGPRPIYFLGPMTAQLLAQLPRPKNSHLPHSVQFPCDPLGPNDPKPTAFCAPDPQPVHKPAPTHWPGHPLPSAHPLTTTLTRATCLPRAPCRAAHCRTLPPPLPMHLVTSNQPTRQHCCPTPSSLLHACPNASYQLPPSLFLKSLLRRLIERKEKPSYKSPRRD